MHPGCQANAKIRACGLLGKPRVAVLGSETQLVLTQVGMFDRADDRPVVSDRAALNPPPAQPDRLHRNARYPDRREQVTLAAANDRAGADAIATPASNHGRENVEADQEENETLPPEPRHTRSVARQPT